MEFGEYIGVRGSLCYSSKGVAYRRYTTRLSAFYEDIPVIGFLF